MRLEEAVNKTIDYARKYGCELTESEVWERLIGETVYQLSNPYVGRASLKSQFKKTNDNNFWKKKLRLAYEFSDKYLSKIDDILMVGVTGSVASKYPKEDDDIDLMIITKKDSLWITRLRIFWIFWINKIPHRTDKNNLCINLWLEDLCVPRQKRSLKNAVDLVLMKPILNRELTYERFLLKNFWVKKFTATPYYQKVKGLKSIEKREGLSLPKMMINYILFGLEYIYMWPKIRGEFVTSKQAFFHIR